MCLFAYVYKIREIILIMLPIWQKSFLSEFRRASYSSTEGEELVSGGLSLAGSS
jgi:hypothetical protein